MPTTGEAIAESAADLTPPALQQPGGQDGRLVVGGQPDPYDVAGRRQDPGGERRSAGRNSVNGKRSRACCRPAMAVPPVRSHAGSMQPGDGRRVARPASVCRASGVLPCPPVLTDPCGLRRHALRVLPRAWLHFRLRPRRGTSRPSSDVGGRCVTYDSCGDEERRAHPMNRQDQRCGSDGRRVQHQPGAKPWRLRRPGGVSPS